MGGARYGGYRARVGLDSTEYTTTTSPNVDIFFLGKESYSGTTEAIVNA